MVDGHIKGVAVISGSTWTKRLMFGPVSCSCCLLALLTATTMYACRYLYRPYGRVDRAKLKRRLLDRCNANGEATAMYTSKARAAAVLLTKCPAC